MSLALFADINWLAVAASALAFFALGGIWYAPPVFGNRWAATMDWDADETEGPGPALYLVPFAGCLVATVALALLSEAIDVTGLAEGIGLGLVTGVGIAAAVLFVTGIFDPNRRKPLLWFTITAGYYAVGLVVVGAILGAWR